MSVRLPSVISPRSRQAEALVVARRLEKRCGALRDEIFPSRTRIVGACVELVDPEPHELPQRDVDSTVTRSWIP